MKLLNWNQLAILSDTGLLRKAAGIAAPLLENGARRH